jgi:hypothetical protein
MSVLILSVLTIIGTWQYAGFRYDGDTYPKPNPNLILKFTFDADGKSHLIWYRTNEAGFCEKRGEYQVQGDKLWQKTTWVNPANDRSCSSDPDMHPGRETTTRFLLSEGELAFVLSLDGRDLFYLLRPVQNVSGFQGH